MKKQNLLIFAAALAAGFLVPAAQADTFLQYTAPSSTTNITFDGTTLIGTAIPVDLSYLDPISGELATGTLSFSATAVAGSASEAFGFFYGVSVDDITFTLTSGGTNILSGTAASGDFSGTDAGLSLTAQDPGVTYTSSLYGPTTDPSFQILTGTPSTDLSVSGGTLSSFSTTATTGAFTGDVSPAPTPEPSSIVLLGTGLLGVLGVARRKLVA